jgi:hypothetical protein
LQTINYAVVAKTVALKQEASLYTMVEKAIQRIQDGKSTTLKDLSLDRIGDAVNRVMSAAIKGDKVAGRVTVGCRL